MALFFSILGGIIFLDFTAGIGLLANILKIYPSFRNLLKEGILLEDAAFYRSWRNSVFKTLILTPQYLILKNSYFTSLINIELSEIDSWALERIKNNKGEVSLQFNSKEQTYKLQFKTSKAKEWEEVLNSLIGDGTNRTNRGRP